MKSKIRLVNIVRIIQLFYILIYNIHKIGKVEEKLDLIIENLNIVQNFITNNYNYVSLYFKSIIGNMSDIFTNRELASGFLILIFILWVVSSKKTRKNVKDIIKAFFSRHLVIFNTAMGSYFLLCIFILDKFSFWENRMWKDALIWLLFTAIVFVSNAITKKDIDYKYFKNLAKESFRVFILLQFITNMGSFSFLVELIILIVLIFIEMSNVLLENDKRYDTKGGSMVYNIFNSIKMMIGFIILYNSIKIIFLNKESIDILKLLKDLLLPSILTIMFIPFTYISSLVSLYQLLFIRISFNKKIKNNIRLYLNIRIFLVCGFSIIRVNQFVRRSNIMIEYINNIEDVKKLISKYKYNLKNVVEA